MQESEREIRQTDKRRRRKEDRGVGGDPGVEEILMDCCFDFSFAHNFFCFLLSFILVYEDCSKLIKICYCGAQKICYCGAQQFVD